LATTALSSPTANRLSASIRSCSRRVPRSAVNPPPRAYLTPQTHRQTGQLSASTTPRLEAQ
jgi:hypothetical protein